MGIEPTCSAWKADILPLNYTRVCQLCYFSMASHICQVKNPDIFLQPPPRGAIPRGEGIYSRSGGVSDPVLHSGEEVLTQ